MAAKAFAWVALSAASAVFLGAWIRWAMKCDEGCVLAGSAGEAWTRYRDSWQWDAQFAIAVSAVVFGLAAVLLIRSRRNALVWAFAGVCAAASIAWATWYALSPPL